MHAQLRRLLYAFKRQWPAEISYVQILESVSDDRTGERYIKTNVIPMTAVQLPQSQIRKFFQDIGYLAANKNFTYGGLNDINTISFLIEKDGFDFDLNGYVNFKGKRYERISYTELYDDVYLLTVRGIQGDLPFATYSRVAFNNIELEDHVTYELN